jgi:hypothetical protein
MSEDEIGCFGKKTTFLGEKIVSMLLEQPQKGQLAQEILTSRRNRFAID